MATTEPLPSDDENNFTISGWRLQIQSHARLAGTDVLDTWARDLNFKGLPEMVFAENHLTLEHTEHNVRLRFCVADALRGCTRAADSEDAPVRVRVAQKWEEMYKPLNIHEIPKRCRSFELFLCNLLRTVCDFSVPRRPCLRPTMIGRGQRVIAGP